MGLFSNKNTSDNYNIINFVDKDFKNVNSFLIIDQNKNAILFDCWRGFADEINEYIKNNELILEHILLSHGHYEHINGLNAIFHANPNAKIYIGSDDLDNLYDPELNLSAQNDSEKFIASSDIKNIVKINSDKSIMINNLKIDFYIRTSHTTGSIIYVINDLKMIFTGDALFVSNRAQVFDESLNNAWNESIKWIVNKINKKYLLMPGHHEFGIPLKSVIKNNVYVKEILSKKKK